MTDFVPTKGTTVMRGFAFGVAIAVMLAGSPSFAQTPTQPAAGATACPQHPRSPPCPRTPAAQPAPPRSAGRPSRSLRVPRLATSCCSALRTSRLKARPPRRKIQALQQKKAAELQDKNKQLQGLAGEAEEGRHGHERDCAGRYAEADGAAQDGDPALHAGRAAGDSGAARRNCRGRSNSA